MDMKYRTILADPPWEQPMSGKWKRREAGKHRPCLPYPTMTLEEIKSLPVSDFAEVGCHLWLWTTNAFLQAGFEVMRAWGFTYLAPVHWRKPSGQGNYFIHHTQTVLFGYFQKCKFNKARYRPNWFEAKPGEHSAKPCESYELIESISDEPRLELFARPLTPLFQNRLGWHVWGNEVKSDIEISVGMSSIRVPHDN